MGGEVSRHGEHASIGHPPRQGVGRVGAEHGAKPHAIARAGKTDGDHVGVCARAQASGGSDVHRRAGCFGKTVQLGVMIDIGVFALGAAAAPSAHEYRSPPDAQRPRVVRAAGRCHDGDREGGTGICHGNRTFRSEGE